MTFPYVQLNQYSISILRGSKKQEASVEEDTKRAERSIRHSISVVENKLHRLIEDEVDTLFHKSSPEKKQDVSAKAKKAVEQGTAKIKEQVEKRSEIHHYPYEWPTKPEAHVPRDHKILHAIENAEKAVLHAVEEEVNNLFHEVHHDADDKETAKKAKAVVTRGVKKAKEQVTEDTEHRRKFLLLDENTSIEDYIKTIPAME